MKRLMKSFVLFVAIIIFCFTFTGVNGKLAFAEEYNYPEVTETSPFSGVRITGINQRVQNILGVDLETGKHLWSVEGKPSGMVNLNLAVQISDWSNATAMRIRIKSNKLPDANESAQDNNIAIGYGVKSLNTDKVVIKMNNPYSNMSYVKKNDQTYATLYSINTQIPYFSMGRLSNAYVKATLDENTFSNVTSYVQSTPKGDTCYQLYSENLQNNIFDYLGEYDLSDQSIYTGSTNKDGQKLVYDSPVDMTQVKFVFIRFEPQNYANMCLDIGDVEILVDGVWQTAVDMSSTSIVQKQEDQTWYQAITSMTANQCILDPTYESGATTDAYKLELIEETPCASHHDGNVDGACDRCFGYLPHVFFDLFGDGVCDECTKTICGEGVCIDNGGDGGCDVCYHSDFVEQPAPDVSDSSSSSSSSNGVQQGGSAQTTPQPSCSGTKIAIILVSVVVLLAGVTVAFLLIRKRQK